MASAKLKATMETPVDCVIGNRKSPVVCRTPIVISKIAAVVAINATICQRESEDFIARA